MLAAAGTIFLLSPIAPISPPPPLAASSSAIRTQVESRFLGHADSHERIEVGVRPDGTPVRIVATQRLDLTAKGDYYFVIPAPATRVVPGPGSESQPGLRDLGIVWQGFANKHRVLSATATLKIAEAAPALPLRISVERGGGGWTVRLANATERRLQAVAGQTTRAALQRVLAQLRAAYHRTPVVAGLWQVAGEPADVAAPGSGRGAPAGARDAVAYRGVARCRWTCSSVGGSHGHASSPSRARSDRRCGCGSSSSRRSRSSRRRPSSTRPASRCLLCRPGSDRLPHRGGTRTTSTRPTPSAGALRSTHTARCGSRPRRRRRRRRRAGETHSRSCSGSCWARRPGRARGALGTLVDRCNRHCTVALRWPTGSRGCCRCSRSL